MLGAAARIKSAKEGSSLRPLKRSRMYAYPLTPSFLHVCTNVVWMSIDRTPRLLRLCKLTVLVHRELESSVTRASG